MRQSIPTSEQFLNASEKVMAFPTAPSQEPVRIAPAPVAPTPPQRDWPSALALIEETSEALRINDLRYTQLEERLQQTIAQAASNMRELEAQIATANELLWRSEERARQAEARALEAEGWLARLHDAVTTSFSPASRPQSRG
ncbi:hypothetical protein IP69_20210 [Bosea sp. AAP35]|nr:hypothetical protein IP69_20210 [Bosea sp. AAP35]